MTKRTVFTMYLDGGPGIRFHARVRVDQEAQAVLVQKSDERFADRHEDEGWERIEDNRVATYVVNEAILAMAEGRDTPNAPMVFL